MKLVLIALLATSVSCKSYVPLDPGDPLFLSEYIESGRIDEGRRAAEVPQLLPGLKSYAGYITVEKEYNSNLFFWYFPAEDLSAPVVVWLQGGPGSSSLYGLFYENGPITIGKDTVEHNPYSWSKISNLIFIDNPVGTGFSFTNSSEGYANNQSEVGENLYNFLVQFMTLFPGLHSNELYITGESYGGKYVPALSYTIHEKNSKSPYLYLNLAGLAIGNGLVYPYYMLNYGDYLFNLGLIDSNKLKEFNMREDEIRQHISAERWSDATLGFGQLILGWGANKTVFEQSTGLKMYYNFLKTIDDDAQDWIGEYVNSDYVRRAIHVGKQPYNDGSQVQTHLYEDIMKSTAPLLQTLMEHYRVVIYNGQLDIICAYPLTVNYLKNLQWCGMNDYKSAPRRIWRVNTDVAGYSKEIRSSNCSAGGWFTELLVRDAGHMVPHDQPLFALDLIARIVHRKEF